MEGVQQLGEPRSHILSAFPPKRDSCWKYLPVQLPVEKGLKTGFTYLGIERLWNYWITWTFVWTDRKSWIFC